MHRCPICRRVAWFTDDSVADHVDRTHADAINALASTQRKPRDKRREHRAYDCTVCGGWHLTSAAERKTA